jgi:hypothetical protein
MLRVVFSFVVGLALSACGRFEGALSFLRESPDIGLLPGTYALDPKMYSFASLQREGYSDSGATITLRRDRTFTMTRVPDCCVYGQYGYFGGYFEGAGDWSVEKSASVYQVRLRFRDIRRSEVERKDQPQLFKEVAFTLTKASPGYGIAAPLFDGEFQYAYFHRKKANNSESCVTQQPSRLVLAAVVAHL